MIVYLRILVICLLLLMAGCSEEPTASAPVAPAPKKVRAEKAPAVAEVAAVEEQKDPFVYNSIGQRDPFVSLLKDETEAKNASVPKTPLEKFDLDQFRIQAILIGKGAPRAMASAPDGKNYILKPGLKIGKNNGVISEINRTAIVVQESTIDLAGNLIEGFRSLTIPDKKTF